MVRTNANFNTAEYESGLIDAGVDPQVAKAHRRQLEIVVASLTSDLVTESSRDLMESRIDNQFSQLRTDFATLKLDIEKQLRGQTAWVVGTGLATIGAIVTLVKLIP